MGPFSKAFYERPTEKVARELLGKYIIRTKGKNKKVVRIVETEAYLGPHDLAAHSRFGQTGRNKVLFGPAGQTYVYLIYGIYNCLNIVTEGGIGAAVLIRAGEPIENIQDKTSGPGLLCQALDIDRGLNDLSVTIDGPLYIVSSNKPTDEIVSSARVGIGYAKDWKDKPLRFHLKGNPFVSRH